jgi:hypothetical protein
MNRAALLVLSTAALLSSCSNDKTNGPFDFAGSCDVFKVEDTTLDTDPANVSRFEVTADCEMGSEIGSTGAVVDLVVTANDVDNNIIVTGQGFYSASQTDILVSTIEGTGTIVSPSTFNFTASESYEGGTNDFDDLFGTGEITGGTLTITAPGSGGWTVVGSII